MHVPLAEGAGATLTYGAIIDSLMILVEATPGGRIVDPANACASLLLNERDEVVDAMNGAFLTHAVHEHLEFQAIASYMRLGSRTAR